MASQNFTYLPRALAKADLDFDTLTAKVLLVTSIPTEGNFDAWVYRSDVGNEHAATGNYTTGGIAQAYTLGALDTTNNRQPITWTNITNGWTSATISAVGAIIYKDTGLNTTDILLHFVDFGGTISSTNGNFSITYSTPFYING